MFKVGESKKNNFKKINFWQSCQNGSKSQVSFFWKIILFSGILFIGLVVFMFSFRSRELKERNVKANPASSLTLNRGALSDVFELYKTEEAFFESGALKIDIPIDPS